MSDQHWGAARVARWAGVLGFVLPAITLVVYPIWSFPTTQTPARDVAQWAAVHHDRLVVTMLLNAVGVTIWLVFGAALIGCITLLLSGFTAFDVMLYRHRNAETASLLYDLTFGLLAMSGMPTAVALACFAVAVYNHRVLPRYTAHLALVAAMVHPLLLLAFVVEDGPLSLEGFSITGMPGLLFAWILGTALAMPRRGRPRRP